MAHLYDYAGIDGKVILPTPEECRTDKPNALSWDISVSTARCSAGSTWSGAIHRWKITNQPEDRDKALRIARG